MTDTSEQAAPLIARWLAPHIARELGLPRPGTTPAPSADYDEKMCAEFVRETWDSGAQPRVGVLYEA